MKVYFYILVILFSFLELSAQLNPEPKKVTQLFFPDNESIENVTPALQKKRGFTDYDELMSFLNTEKSKHADLVRVEFIGKSQKGYDIPIIYIHNQSSQKDKLKVWLQGGLHGNEPASTEGVLYLIYQLLNNADYSYLLDQLEFAIVPMANIDGYLKLDRYAANGLDLNRDQTKLMAPESVIIKQAYSNFNPEVALDFHEYNAYRRDFAKMGSFGITSAYDVMFLYSSNLNVPDNIRTVIDTLFVESARKTMDNNNLRHHDYMSTGTYSGDIHFNMGSTNARSSATNFALTNTISALIEVRGVNLGRNSFKRRINTTFLVGMACIETAYNHAELIKNTIQTATQPANNVTVTSKQKVYQKDISVIDLDSYELTDMTVTVRDSKQSAATLIRDTPEAYIILPEQKDLIEKLKVLGVAVETLEAPTVLTVESYLVSSYSRDETTYEKMNLQTVEATVVEKEMTFPAGSFKISTHQKNVGLVYEILEPEAPNSVVSFGVLKTELNQELPIYRLSKTN
ncbi:peptidase [Paucihalobacter ruber]|uniref:Peptidase n=1 Tax=Paucihalobacter ruber TaxID=2567861 RepID=A0A506PLQ5_9FLAO|nr:M14 family metallocarboxypeptidase [Paucihalobacter ruber]TPV34047.1 peptidase [Paucihalobacter ruber]